MNPITRWGYRSRRKLKAAFGIPVYASIKQWRAAQRHLKLIAADAKIPEPWLKSFWETLTHQEQQIYMAEYLGDGSWGGSKAFPELQHVAFSNLPGVGRPIPADGVLNSDWECPEPERKIREEWRAWHVEVEQQIKAVNVHGTWQLAHPRRDGTPPEFTFPELHATLRARVTAAKRLEKLVASPPQQPK